MEKSSVRLDRVPPQNIDAERSVLGAMLLSDDGGREAIPKVIEILGDDSYGDVFYKETHQKIYNAILNLFERNEPADQVTLTRELMRTGDLEKVGDITYIDEMIDSVPTAANVVHYAKIVKEEALRRRLIRASAQIYNDSYDNTEDVDMLLDNAERIVLDIRREKADRGFIQVRKKIKETLDVIQELYNRKEHVIGTPTGFTDFDSATSGLQASDFIVVAGRPGMGKSMFVQNIAQHVAGEHKTPVGLFSLEMSYQQILLRILSAEANVNFQNLRTGFLSDSDWPKLTLAAGKIYEYPMLIDDTPGISVMEIRAKARRMKAEYNIGLIIIDYLQLMQSRNRSENRQQEISEISRSLKGLARELNIPIIACSQLSRATEGRPDKRPMLSDLRESGAIEQDADLVVFLYREEYYEREPTEKSSEAEVIIGKQRNGPTCTIRLSFRANCMRFDNLDKRFK
jgi:replicative DNA helicase